MRRREEEEDHRQEGDQLFDEDRAPRVVTDLNFKGPFPHRLGERGADGPTLGLPDSTVPVAAEQFALRFALVSRGPMTDQKQTIAIDRPIRVTYPKTRATVN